ALARYRKAIRCSDLVIVEGGLLGLAFALRLFGTKHHPIFVFDLITLMSSLHRDHTSKCTLTCKFRRAVWRVLEFICVGSSDVSVAGGPEDARRLSRGHVDVVPHVVAPVEPVIESDEDPNLIGFLGSGPSAPPTQRTGSQHRRAACGSLSAMISRTPCSPPSISHGRPRRHVLSRNGWPRAMDLLQSGTLGGAP